RLLLCYLVHFGRLCLPLEDLMPYGYRPPVSLRSFPTRRSSDLAALLGGHFHSLRIQPDASGVALWSGSFGRIATGIVAGAGLLGDRKSTRLNSSHQIISYAVLCLKKKKKIRKNKMTGYSEISRE